MTAAILQGRPSHTSNTTSITPTSSALLLKRTDGKGADLLVSCGGLAASISLVYIYWGYMGMTMCVILYWTLIRA